MARRAPHPKPLGMRIERNITTGLYEVHEENITYAMPLELTRQLKEYYRGFRPAHQQHYPTMDRWYRDLNNEQRKQVKRSGNVPQDPVDFFPDPEWE